MRRRAGSRRRPVPTMPWRRRCATRTSPCGCCPTTTSSTSTAPRCGCSPTPACACSTPAPARGSPPPGCAVDDLIVRFDPELVEHAVAGAPSQFTLRARNPDARPDHRRRPRGVRLGRRAGVRQRRRARPPPRHARRAGEYLRVIQQLGVVHHEGGGPFEPMDLPPETRHLDVCHSLIRHLDKNWQGILLGRERATDCIEMVAIALGTDRDGLLATAGAARHRQHQHAAHARRPDGRGDHRVRRGRAGRVHHAVHAGRRDGAGRRSPARSRCRTRRCWPARRWCSSCVAARRWCTARSRRTSTCAAGRRRSARPSTRRRRRPAASWRARYGLPFRSSNTTASNTVDAQAAYESAMSLWGAVMGGANLVNHAAGWLEGGLTASFEKLIIDAEMLQMMAEYLEPIVVDDGALAARRDRRGRPRRPLLRLSRTRWSATRRRSTRRWSATGATSRRWYEDGAVDATERAHRIWRRLRRRLRSAAHSTPRSTKL